MLVSYNSVYVPTPQRHYLDKHRFKKPCSESGSRRGDSRNNEGGARLVTRLVSSWFATIHLIGSDMQIDALNERGNYFLQGVGITYIAGFSGILPYDIEQNSRT